MGCTPTMGLTCTSLLRLTFILALSIMASNAMADSNKDREECTEQLVGLATCLPYVGNQAKAPTPDCCTGLRQVLKDNKKCLCVIIKDRDDPQLGLNINVTLALGLPSVCHAPANVSQCPVLLHMDPNSPEAHVFFQVAKGSNHAARSPTSGSNEGNSVSADKRRTSTGQEKSHGCCSRNRRLGCEIAIGGLLLWYLIT